MEKIKLNKLKDSDLVPSNIDLFICSASFEKRSISIADTISKTKQIKKVLVLNNTNFINYIQENKNSLVNLFKPEILEKIDLDTSQPLQSFSRINKVLADNVIEKSNILIDITTFTHESLLFLVWCIKNNNISESNIIFVYTSALEYSIGDNKEEKWLSKGIKDIRSIIGYPGEIVPSKPSLLLIITGYEYERALGIIELIQPSKLLLAYGKTGSETISKGREANKHFCELLQKVSSFSSDVDNFEMFCNDIILSKDEIIKRIKKYEENYNIIIAPMNNKMSTLACALVSFEKPQIQLCYSEVLQYNYKNYSTPGNYCYAFTLPEIFKQ